jgi:AraC family transcriptional regulator, dual regulator of chb operon
MNESISSYQIAHPITLCFKTQVDPSFGGLIKFHHIYHSYAEYHNHDFYEFFICTQGRYEQIINGKSRYFSRLASCLLFPSDAHATIEKEKDSGHYSINVEKAFFEKMVEQFAPPCFLEQFKELGSREFTLSEARLKKIVQYLAQIKEHEGNDETQHPLIVFLLFNLIESMYGQNGLNEENKRPAWLKELLVEVNKPENLYWDVSEAVSHTNYSKTHLCRLFKEHMGVSLGEYLQKVKISNARDLLVNSDMSLSELCDIIGHSSLSHFSSIFKKTYGMAPGKYRAKFKAAE